MRIFKPLNDNATYKILNLCYNNKKTLKEISDLFPTSIQATLKKINALVECGLLVDDKGLTKEAKNLRQLYTNSKIVLDYIYSKNKLQLKPKLNKKFIEIIERILVVRLEIEGDDDDTYLDKNIMENMFNYFLLGYVHRDKVEVDAIKEELVEELLNRNFFRDNLDKTAHHTINILHMKPFLDNLIKVIGETKTNSKDFFQDN